MDSTSRSPLFSHFSETLSGLPTIRAYGQQHPFILTNADRMDNNNRFYFLIAASQRWLGTRMELMGGLIIFSTAVIASTSASSIPSGLVGLSLSYAMQVTQQMSLFLRQSVETENYMNSVERARFYTNGIAHEAASSVPDADSAPEVSGSSWPCSGKIEFEGASMRYREGLKLVMDRVSFSIAGGERVGIVGRTGAGQCMRRHGLAHRPACLVFFLFSAACRASCLIAHHSLLLLLVHSAAYPAGKSSLMVALFRIVEAAGGSIKIDGQDISALGLNALRSKLAIIPQDPVLYSGTVRSNLDPFDQYTDAQLWDVLEKSYLKATIAALDLKLQAPISEGGENMSVGERCQLCLARAMLRNAKVLIMDEATASVDMQTDAFIQNSLRKHFNCTLLTIAHRLNTICDYDRVLVLSFGRVQEYDSPANLLRDPNSAFSSMVNETGEVNAALLRNIAFKVRHSAHA